MPIPWSSAARHAAQTAGFCLAIAALQYGFAPDRPWQPLLAYSLCIGLITWAVIDLGRHALPAARGTGWPHGWPGVLLVLAGIATGYLLGNALADLLCQRFGWYHTNTSVDLQAEIRRSLLITLVATVVGVYYFYSRGRSAYLEREMLQARGLAAESQLRLLQSQLEPHMLFNTLANLRALIATDPPRAIAMLDQLNRFLRATLQASRNTRHPLADEYDRLRDYLALMSVRMGARLRCTLTLPDTLASHPVPPLLLQPLVENAIRHGLEPARRGGEITVHAESDGQTLWLEVRDDGIGCDGDPTEDFGLAQVRERLLNAYGPQARLHWHSARGQGTRVRLQLPLWPAAATPSP
ncbi:sensor histidine kinase [Hydrogenophaga sp. NFH-34]|uniref:sensor histidine kinase n=1 Tax=Hydrogenophaga sp. NFH-34 TaxID=2744446 RepID=UPI001F3C5DDB|nr:histidine kinase [Hydrogenophaga sp. NFH-34]